MLSELIDGAWVDRLMLETPTYVVRNDHREVIFESWILQEPHMGAGKAELHRILRPDALRCFHGHPYESFRIILRGGYREEIVEPWWTIDTFPLPTRFRIRAPGYHGPVGKEFYHRIDSLLGGSSVSLWFTEPERSSFRLIGEGWGNRHGEWIK